MKKFLLPLFALLLLTACEKERAGPVGAEADTAIDFRGLKAESFGGNVDPGSTAAYSALIDGGSSGFNALLGGGRRTDGSFNSPPPLSAIALHS